jgi:predicted transport protein
MPRPADTHGFPPDRRRRRTQARHVAAALDPCVTEEFMKLYVAYKAETNFVDVVPQAKRLRLSINMAFSDIFDPKESCREVTNLGRWGNGDIEVGLKSLEELPDIMGLVRQSYERQMGGDSQG